MKLKSERVEEIQAAVSDALNDVTNPALKRRACNHMSFRDQEA